jgi:hypothetical protein
MRIRNPSPIGTTRSFRVLNHRCCGTGKRGADPPMDGSLVQARMLPQLSGCGDRIEINRLPPLRFVAPVVEDTMVGAAERNRELVADPAAQCAGLGEPQVMGV